MIYTGDHLLCVMKHYCILYGYIKILIKIIFIL